MARDKQKLLEIHRRHKRYLLSLGILLALASAWLHWVLPVLVGLLLWVAHEAWWSDHLFYSPQADYAYDLGGAGSFAVEVGDTLSVRNGIPDGSTLILEVTVCATVTGRFVDPHILLGNERFDFERGVSGRRFLDISQAVAAEKNFDQLLPQLLSATIAAADADAGVLKHFYSDRGIEGMVFAQKNSFAVQREH